MKKNELFFKSSDGITNVYKVIWEPEDEVKGVIQIVHGVTEHIMRYEEMAEYFTNKGIAVVGIDLLGHGLSTNNGSKKMYFGGVGSFKFLVDDLNTCIKHTKELFSHVPYILLGFSLGSFVVRTYLIDYPYEVDGAILVGTGTISNFEYMMAKRVVNSEIKKYGEMAITDKIRDLTFGAYNKKFLPNKTEYDWLCRSEESLNKYITDPLKGEAMSTGVFRELLEAMKYTNDKKNILKMKNIPLYLLSGSEDAVGNFGKGINSVCKLLKNGKIDDVSMKIYEGLRHDILHEDNRTVIYEDIYEWWEEKINKRLFKRIIADKDEVNSILPKLKEEK